MKRWSSGEMALRWTAAGMFEAERQFRRVIGYEQLAALALAVERDVTRATTPTEEVATLVPPDRHSGTAVQSSTTGGTSSARARWLVGGRAGVTGGLQ